MGWYYTSKNERLAHNLLVTEQALEQEKINYENIREALDANNAVLQEMEREKDTLQRSIDSAGLVIQDLQDQQLQAIRDINSRLLPQECENKIDWIIEQTRSE